MEEMIKLIGDQGVAIAMSVIIFWSFLQEKKEDRELSRQQHAESLNEKKETQKENKELQKIIINTIAENNKKSTELNNNIANLIEANSTGFKDVRDNIKSLEAKLTELEKITPEMKADLEILKNQLKNIREMMEENNVKDRRDD